MTWFCGSSPPAPPRPATVKAAITQLHASIVTITGICKNVGQDDKNENEGTTRGIGVLIHPTLVLTTHSTIPSAASLKDAQLSCCLDVTSLSYARRKFVPEIFFQTDAELDLTVVSCEIVAPEIETLALDTSRLSQKALRKGRIVFVMGCQVKDPEEVVILEGGIADLQKGRGLPPRLVFQAGDSHWMPGSAGFDEFGTFSFIVTSPSKKLQDSVMNGKPEESILLSKLPKQQAISIQVVKDWLEPLWRTNRDEIYRGPELSLAGATPIIVDNGFRRPSTVENPAPRQKLSVPQSDAAPRSVVPQSKDVPKSVVQQRNVVPDNKTSTPTQQVNLQTPKNVESPPQQKIEPCHSAPLQQPPEQMKPASKSIGVETIPDHLESPKLPKAAPGREKHPRGVASPREQKPKRDDFRTMKQKKGTKKQTNKKTAEPVTDSVSVQTELFVTDADVKPMMIVRPESSLDDQTERVRKGPRERWSLPADGHALDFLRGDDESPPVPTVIRRSRASLPLADARSTNLKDMERMPAWMDKYYARGRSLSEAPSRVSSAGATPPRPRRHVVSDTEPDSDNYDTASVSGSSTRSMPHGDAVYSKPTISYMQKRNSNQRDAILARQASQTQLPRWT
ncbi:hypothetical protein KP509_35G019800 [Ceratopteris richardii]|uniref:Uncharacterized protein n=1 Tax=Ceratopteris richardii TaxID=49495 RepID=A0A8T2QF13_CERRI|nr:hypothetical protein KP509_35G019800 [Ceratopteris richardii]